MVKDHLMDIQAYIKSLTPFRPDYARPLTVQRSMLMIAGRDSFEKATGLRLSYQDPRAVVLQILIGPFFQDREGDFDEDSKRLHVLINNALVYATEEIARKQQMSPKYIRASRALEKFSAVLSKLKRTGYLESFEQPAVADAFFIEQIVHKGLAEPRKACRPLSVEANFFRLLRDFRWGIDRKLNLSEISCLLIAYGFFKVKEEDDDFDWVYGNTLERLRGLSKTIHNLPSNTSVPEKLSSNS